MIDIIIPNYNGAHLLPTCLQALRRQTRQDFRVLVVDDGSTDDSQALLARDYPEVRVLALSRNRGLAAAVNAALSATDGDFVVLLNNDTEADERWLAQLVGTLERFPQFDFAASKLMLFDQRDRIHSAGDYYQPNGVPGSRGVWEQDRGQYDAVAEVWGACAGAAAYRRSVLETLAEHGKIFDEDLVMYCEDVDLNLRAQAQGVRTVFVPQAIVYHRLSATGGGALASYYCGRNFMLVWAKNVPAEQQRRQWPALVRSELGFALHALWHARETAARARLRGQWQGLRALPQFLNKRPTTNDQRRIKSDQQQTVDAAAGALVARHSSLVLTGAEVSTDQPFLSVIIPAYNEERRLPDTLAQVLAYLDQQSYRSEVIVADDGSSDGTAAIVENIAARRGDVRLLRLDHRGKGFAVRAGALAATGEYVLFSDADLAVPMEEWSKLYHYLDNDYDVVIGSREGMGARRLGEPWHRHVMGRVFNLIVRVVAVGGIQDTQCGYKAFSRRAAQDIFQRVQLYGDHTRPVRGAAVTAFDVEVLFIARRRGYRIREVPVLWRYGEETKVSAGRDSLRNLSDVLRVRWNAVLGRYNTRDVLLPSERGERVSR